MNKILTFEISTEKDELEIHLDDDGLDLLISELSGLRNKHDHLHLMTPSWGGHELTEEKQGKSNMLINQVNIYHWSNNE
jgi:hypothetical protein